MVRFFARASRFLACRFRSIRGLHDASDNFPIRLRFLLNSLWDRPFLFRRVVSRPSVLGVLFAVLASVPSHLLKQGGEGFLFPVARRKFVCVGRLHRFPGKVMGFRFFVQVVNRNGLGLEVGGSQLIGCLAIVNYGLCRLIVVFHARVRRVVVREVLRFSFRIRFVIRIQPNALTHVSCLPCRFPACRLLPQTGLVLTWVYVPDRVPRAVVRLSRVSVANFPSHLCRHSISHDVGEDACVNERVRSHVGLNYFVGEVCACAMA